MGVLPYPQMWAKIRRNCALACLLLLPALAPAAPPPSINWTRADAETLRHFTALLRINTSNPPGHETRAATYLKAVLDRAGIPAQLLALDPARANLVARLKGDDSLPPIAILGHTDVVPVQRAHWFFDPFAAVRRHGFIYGRGAIDDKEIVTAGLMVMLLLHRQHVPLHRDIIFIAEAGEEGTPRVGINFLVRHYWSSIAAQYALAEGGSAVAVGGRVRLVTIATAEKVPRGVRLIAHGPSGHASCPTPDNAVTRLAAAVAKLGQWRTPMRVSSTTRAYFNLLASISDPADADRYRHVGDPQRAPEIDAYFRRYEPESYALLHTTLAPTILNAGIARNVIPSTAEAFIDIRALPDEDMPRFYARMRALINDPDISILPYPADRPATPPSSTDTAMFRALEHAQREMFPDAITVPALLTGATDLAQLRARGVQAYGFGPVVEAGSPGQAHADNERLPAASLYELVRFLFLAVREVAAAP